MTRERIWFIFTVLIVIVLVVAFAASKISQVSEQPEYTNNEQPALDTKEEYVVSEILPVSEPVSNLAAVGSSSQSAEVIKPREVGEGCYVGGCSNQICTDVKDVVSTCEWHESYSCYNDAVCKKQPDGECGWSRTDEIMQCLAAIIPGLEI